jgi:hypothetical protein
MLFAFNGKLEAGADYRGDDSAAGFLAITGAYFKISYIFYQNSFSSLNLLKHSKYIALKIIVN